MSARLDGEHARLLGIDPRHGAQELERIAPAFRGAARYPAVSPDGARLVFAHQERTGWQLWLLDVASGAARPLTAGDCNSISPAWEPDGAAIVYATDCGRGFDQCAIGRIDVGPPASP